MERLYAAVYAGGWVSRLARPLGLQGTLRVATHNIALADGDPALPPLRIAFASDFHAGPSTHPATIREACRLLAESRPDLLLLGGDFVAFHARHVESLLEPLRRIAPPLGTFAVLGNHDLMADDAYLVERLAEAGVRTLVNANARLPAPYDGVSVCGLDNTEQGEPDGERALAGAAETRIVLMHSPDGLSALGDAPFALALAGHVHGGQFVLPNGKVMVGSKGPLSQRYLFGGLFELGGVGRRVLLVSRGIGQTSLPMRYGADPEVHVCTVRIGAGVVETPLRHTL